MGPQFKDDAGDPLVSSVIPPTVHAFPQRVTHNALYIDVQRVLERAKAIRRTSTRRLCWNGRMTAGRRSARNG